MCELSAVTQPEKNKKRESCLSNYDRARAPLIPRGSSLLLNNPPPSQITTDYPSLGWKKKIRTGRTRHEPGKSAKYIAERGGPFSHAFPACGTDTSLATSSLLRQALSIITVIKTYAGLSAGPFFRRKRETGRGCASKIIIKKDVREIESFPLEFTVVV